MKIVQTSRNLKQRLGALALILVAGTANVDAAPQRMPITFAGYAGGRTALTDFPVLVVLSNNVGESGFNYSHFLRNDGFDLRFKANPGDTVNLNYEIETWDTNGTSFVWVQAPTLPGDGYGTLWAMWGRESEQLACTTNGAVWSNGYRSVWHLGLTNGVTDLTDWTPNRRNGVNNGTVSATGMIGQGRDFERSDPDYIDVPTGLGSVYVPTSNAPITLSCWFKAESITTANMDHRLINTHDGSPSTAIALGLGATNKLQTNIDGSGSGGSNLVMSGSTSLSTGQWYHGAVSYDGNVCIIYLNGVEVARTAVGTKLNPGVAYAAKLGVLSSTQNQFDGVLDEARISSVARSADWLWACHRNQASNAVFNAFGAMEPDEPDLPRIENVVLRSRANTSADVVGRLITNGTTAATVNIYWSTEDGTTNAAAWTAAGGVTAAGSYADGATFTNAIGPLTANTTYYWNHNAVNASGTVWAATAGSPSFKTFGPPTVNNGIGATSAGVSTVTLNGALTNGAPASVFFDWWVDGAGSTNRIDLGAPRELGVFSANLSELTPSTTYRYQAFASNAYGTALADSTNFTTLALVTTNGNVTWSGTGAVPFWDVPANWAGNAAPTNPTAGRITFGNAGQAVMSVLEVDRSVKELYAGFNSNGTGYTCTHTIDLGGHTLSVTSRLQVVAGHQNNRSTLNFTNGTVRVGSDAVTGYLDVLATGTLAFKPGSRLDPYNLHTLTLGANAYGSTYMDLSGAMIVGGTLKMRRLYMNGLGWYGNSMYLNQATAMDAFVVTEVFELGKAEVNQATPQFIGNPLDTFTLDGATFGRFPAGIDLVIGTGSTARASLLIAEHTLTIAAATRAAIRVAPGGGGEFRAYLSTMNIGSRSGTGERRPRALLDVSAMDSCMLDAVSVQIGPGRSGALSTDDEQGELWLPQGTATVGSVTLGATDGIGFGRLVMSNTLFTVTNSIALRKTGRITINLTATSKGLDIEKGFADGGGTILVNFMAAPDAGTTNWAIRMAGDTQSALNSMLGGTPRLTATGAYPGMKIGVLYDGTHTYFAMAESNAFVSLPVAQAHDEPTFEMITGSNVVLGPTDIDNGSRDPDGRPFTLTIATNGGPFGASVTFDTLGDYTVTLKIEAGGEVATDTCTVHIVPPHAGVGTALTWLGGASTELMDRHEWLWSGNWVGGVPPADPTTATLNFIGNGQSVMGIVEKDRTVGAIQSGVSGFVNTHTIDLGGKTLTLSDRVQVIHDATSARDTLIFTNGTLRIGTDTQAANIYVGQAGSLILRPGTQLDTHNVHTISLTAGAYYHTEFDLRGAVLVGGRLKARHLLVNGEPWFGTRLYINAATTIDNIEATDRFELGNSSVNDSVVPYIGDPANTFVMDTQTFGRLPPGIDLTVGVSPSSRATMLIAQDTGGHLNVRAALRASGGGAFTAYLTSLGIGTRSGVGVRRPYGLLDLSAMDSCLLNAVTLTIAPGRAGALTNDSERGALYLPQGTATVGTALVGATNGIGFGLIEMSNTVFTVTNTLTIAKTGDVVVRVGATSSGLDILRSDPGALAVDATATITLRFLADPVAKPHYGLRWSGDHMATLTAMLGDGRLVIDDTALPKPAEIYKAGGNTYVGLPPAAGTVLMWR